MKKQSIFLLLALLIMLSSCEDLCDKGLNPFCEGGNQPPASGVYTKKALGPNGEGVTAFFLGNKGYVGLGGMGFPPDFDGRKEFYSYDPIIDQWDTVRSFPGQGRLYAMGFSIGNKGYVGGGYVVGWVDTSFAEITFKDFYEYDPNLNSWTRKEQLPGGNGIYVGFSVGDKGYALKEGKFWEYNSSTNRWAPKTDCPVPTGKTFSIGKSGYVLHGRKLYEYHAPSNKWTAKADSPEEEYGATFATSNRGFLVNRYHTFEYNPVKNIWVKKTDTPEIRAAEDDAFPQFLQYAFNIKNKGYIGIRYRSKAVHFFEFDPNR